MPDQPSDPTSPAGDTPVLEGRASIKAFAESVIDTGPGVLASEKAWAMRYLQDVRFLLEELGDPIITGREAFLKRTGVARVV